MLCIKRGYAFWGDALREGWPVLFFCFCLINANIELRFAAVLALLPEPCTVLANRLDLLAIIVRDRVADRIGAWICTILDNVLEEFLVHLQSSCELAFLPVLCCVFSRTRGKKNKKGDKRMQEMKRIHTLSTRGFAFELAALKNMFPTTGPVANPTIPAAIVPTI
jgi:hypothetical protein